MNQPIRDMLYTAQDTIRLHMPGHKGQLDPYDMTELARTDDLYAPVAGIAEAERLAAASCGAARTLLLTGGSTAGLMAMILSSVAPGERLLLPRNVHHAVLSACIWGDINAIFTDEGEAWQDANAILVTRPDYYGRCIDLAPLVKKAHARGMLVLVDEAHGAHFSWWQSPQSAGKLGADAWVQSAHKTLPAYTGAAWLHLSAAIDANRVRRFLRMVQTSSPPFPILLSLDDTRAWMDEHGAAALTAVCDLLHAFRTRLAALPGYTDMSNEDPTRLVIGTRARGYTGLEAQALLSAQRVDVEMADTDCIVCICTVADSADTFSRLYDALASIPPREAMPPTEAEALPAPGPRRLSLRAAALSPQEAVPLKNAAGRIAAISAGMYPPGIPLVLPGEEVSDACAQKLSLLPSGRRFGVEGDCMICVK